MAEVPTGLSHAEMRQLQRLMLKVARGEVGEVEVRQRERVRMA